MEKIRQPEAEKDKELLKTWSELLIKAKLGKEPALLISEDKGVNASAHDFKGNDQVVIGSAVPEKFQRPMLAHELGHVKYGHVRSNPDSMGMWLMALVALLAIVSFGEKLGRQFNKLADKCKSKTKVFCMRTGALAGLTVFIKAGSLVSHNISNSGRRDLERQADEFAAELVPAQESYELHKWLEEQRDKRPLPGRVLETVSFERHIPTTHPTTAERMEFFRERAEKQRAEAAESLSR